MVAANANLTQEKSVSKIGHIDLGRCDLIWQRRFLIAESKCDGQRLPLQKIGVTSSGYGNLPQAPAPSRAGFARTLLQSGSLTETERLPVR